MSIYLENNKFGNIDFLTFPGSCRFQANVTCLRSSVLLYISYLQFVSQTTPRVPINVLFKKPKN